MTRVNSKRSANSRPGTVKPSSRRAHSHKVIFESFIEEQKSRTVISFEAKAPAGFRFIRAGNPRLTQKCKELSQEYDKSIYLVSTSHKRANNITQHVHRIGYHFAGVVVKRACRALGLRVTRDGRVIVARADASGGQAEHGIAEADVSSQEKINAQARDALTEFFPKMPERDKNQIISHAFREGKKKVGTAKNLPFVRRVQLAVLAHIRHAHTDYDYLLRTGSCQKLEARACVEQACYRKIVEWSGDEENANVMKEILREVIVISDDEEDDEMSVDSSTDEEDSVGQDSDVEFICSRPIIREPEPNSSRFEQAKERADGIDNDDNNKLYIRGQNAKNRRKNAAESVQPLRRSKRLRMINRRGFRRYSAFKDLQDDELPSNIEIPARLHRSSPSPGRSNVPDTRHVVDTRYPTGDSLGRRISGHEYRDQSVISPTVPFSHPWEQRALNSTLAGQVLGLGSPRTTDQDHTFLYPKLHVPTSVVDGCRDNAIIYPHSVPRRDNGVSTVRRSSDTALFPQFDQGFSPPTRQDIQGQLTRVSYVTAPRTMSADHSKIQDIPSSTLEPRRIVLPSTERSQDPILRYPHSTGPGQRDSSMFHASQNAQFERGLHPGGIERMDMTDHGFKSPDIRNQILEGSRRPSYTIMTEGETSKAPLSNTVLREPQFSILKRDSPPMKRRRSLAILEVDEMPVHSTTSSLMALNNNTSTKMILAPMAGTVSSTGDSHHGKQLPIRRRAARPLHDLSSKTSPSNFFTARRNDFPSSFRSFIPDHASLAYSQGPLSDFNRCAPSSGDDDAKPSPDIGRGIAESGLDLHTVPVKKDLPTHGRVQRDYISPSTSAEHLQGYRQVMRVDHDRTSQTHLMSESPIPRMVPRYSLPSGQASPGYEPHARYFDQAQGLDNPGLAASVHDANVRYRNPYHERRSPQEFFHRNRVPDKDHTSWRPPGRHLQEPQQQQSLAARLGTVRILEQVAPYERDGETNNRPENRSPPKVIVLD